MTDGNDCVRSTPTSDGNSLTVITPNPKTPSKSGAHDQTEDLEHDPRVSLELQSNVDTSKSASGQHPPHLALDQMPQEILEMIFARIPFELEVFLGLRLVCRKFHQIIDLDNSDVLLTEIARISLPDALAVFIPHDESIKLRTICQLQDATSHARSIMEYVMNNISQVDSLDDVKNWPDILYRALHICELFGRIKYSHPWFRSYGLTVRHMSDISVEVHVLRRYACAKLARYIRLLAMRSESGIKRMQELCQVSQSQSHTAEARISSELYYPWPLLKYVFRFLESASGCFDDDHRTYGNCSCDFYITSAERQRFIERLARYKPWRNGFDFESWLCNPDRFARSKDPLLMDDAVTQRLIARLFEAENLSGTANILNYLGSHPNVVTTRWRSLNTDKILDRINRNDPRGKATVIKILHDCDLELILDAELLRGDSKLRRSMPFTNDCFERAFESMKKHACRGISESTTLFKWEDWT